MQQPPSSTTFPVVVKVNLYPWRTLHIENKGKAAIANISVVFAEFTFNEDAYAQKNIVIETASFPSGEVSLEKLLNPGNKFDTDIKRFLFHRTTFEEYLKNQNVIPSEYAARVTFRDSQTGKKYACYKVFSSVDGMPEEWGDMAGTGGGYNRVRWWLDIPKLITDAMMAHYQDGAIENQCER
jgi:hypothetical protein